MKAKGRIKKFAVSFLAVTLVFGLLAGTVMAEDADTETSSSETAASVSAITTNTEGLWLTEIYNNDVDRSEENNTRDTNGYDDIYLYDYTTDLMEFIEVFSTFDEDISLNDEYEIYAGDTKLTIVDENGNSDITISPETAVVIWNYRNELSKTIPTVEEFREEMRVPDDAVVLLAECGENWATTCTFSIVRVSDGETVSTFTATKSENTDDGLAVELKVPNVGYEMEEYRALTLPSAGVVYYGQMNGQVDADVPDEEYAEGLYITEINANDVSRESTYGTSSDVMECIEIVNTTDHDIDLNEEYSIYYTVKEGSRKLITLYHYDEDASDHVGSSQECIIPAGGVAILWCYRESSLSDYTSFPTEEEFREAYDLDDDVAVYIFTNQNGMNNTNRSVEIYENEEDGSRTLVSSYSYQGGGVDLKDNKSVKLSVNPEGPEMFIYETNTAYDMGNVEYDQYEYIQDDGSYIGLEIKTEFNEVVPGTVTQGEDYRVYWTYTDSTLPRTGITTYYRFDGEGSWYSVTETSRRVPNLYETLISADEIFSHEYLEFYVCAENTYHKTLTDIYTVEIEQLNDVDGIRTNISDGEEVSGTVTITANDGEDNSSTKIYIDGEEYSTFYTLEDGAYLTFDTDGRDNYFKNALTTTDNEIIAAIGKWQYTILDGQAVHIDNSYFTYNEETDSYDVTLRFWAGTYGTTVDEYLLPDANREDFTVTEIVLQVAGGEIYLPVEIGPDDDETSLYTNLSCEYDAVHTIGDSSGMCPYMDVSFSIPASEGNAVGTTIDTTAMSDGEHTLTVTNGESTSTVTFIVDNTSPVIDLGIEEDDELTGSIVLDPQVSDANTLNDIVVLLDGEQIETPYASTAYELGDGEHVLTVYADDAAGNYTTETVTFTVSGALLNLTEAGTIDITDSSATAYLSLESASGADVTVYEAEAVSTESIETTTTEGILPYITYTINVGEVEDDDVIVIDWDGEASNADDTHASTMYVLNTVTGDWDKIATADSDGYIEEASFTAQDHVSDGTATVIVQCTADSALADLDTTTSGVTSDEITWDGDSIPEDYDFCFVWETDTQYYAEEYQYHYLNINNWIVDNADELGIEYVIHTGDIVDDYDMIYEWENADEAMSILDEAGIPYGVLGGNHDVAAGLEDYENYYTYFGEDRFLSQETYGGSYENNAGHYDLLTIDGQDFIIVYMSWNIYADELDWINEVLEEYSDRMAILCFHTYSKVTYNTDGTLQDYFGQLVQQEVVAENENVFLVLNGHYHGSSYQTDTFDDDGDGIAERTVYQICTDYQSALEGGTEYLKLLYFDLDNGKIYINSYSPYLDDYNYYDTDEVLDISYDGAVGISVDKLVLDVDFDTTQNTILADSFSAYICRGTELGTAALEDNTGTAAVELTGLDSSTTYCWYAEITNDTSGYLQTGIYSFTTADMASDNGSDDGLIYGDEDGSDEGELPGDGSDGEDSSEDTTVPDDNGDASEEETKPETETQPETEEETEPETEEEPETDSDTEEETKPDEDTTIPDLDDGTQDYDDLIDGPILDDETQNQWMEYLAYLAGYVEENADNVLPPDGSVTAQEYILAIMDLDESTYESDPYYQVLTELNDALTYSEWLEANGESSEDAEDEDSEDTAGPGEDAESEEETEPETETQPETEEETEPESETQPETEEETEPGEGDESEDTAAPDEDEDLDFDDITDGIMGEPIIDEEGSSDEAEKSTDTEAAGSGEASEGTGSADASESTDASEDSSSVAVGQQTAGMIFAFAVIIAAAAGIAALLIYRRRIKE